MTDKLFRKRLLRIQTALVFLSFILVILGTVLYLSYNITRKKYVLTDANVINIIDGDSEDNKESKIIIEYIYDGRDYETHYPFFDRSLDIADKVSIYINPKNPYEVKTYRKNVGLWSIALVVVGMGIGSLFSFKSFKLIKELKRKSDLMYYGKRYLGTILCVEEDNKNILFSITPKIIEVEVENDQGEVFILNSPDIYDDASLVGLVNRKVAVYSKDNKFVNYFINHTEVE